MKEKKDKDLGKAYVMFIRELTEDMASEIGLIFWISNFS